MKHVRIILRNWLTNTAWISFGLLMGICIYVAFTVHTQGWPEAWPELPVVFDVLMNGV